MNLTAEEKDKLQELDDAVQAAEREKIVYIREIFRRRGLTAETLEELKSDSGEPFVEIEKILEIEGIEGLRAIGLWGIPGYKRAVSVVQTGFGPYARERAYLCKGPYEEEDDDTCGWVLGGPQEQSYDDIGPLSGSAGVNYFCRICGKQVGELVRVRS